MNKGWLRRSLGVCLGFAALAYACSDSASAPSPAAPKSVIDATPEARRIIDEFPPGQRGVDCDEPGDVSSFEPRWKPPAPLAQQKCTNAQVDALMCQLDRASDQATCAALALAPANDLCQKCLFTPVSAAELGPFVVTGDVQSINVAGCIARLEGDISDQGCGAKVQAAEQCYADACDDNGVCDAGDAGDAGDPFNPRARCFERAANTVCQEFTTGARLCMETSLALDAAAPACASPGTFIAHATALARLFCAGGAADASTDASEGG